MVGEMFEEKKLLVTYTTPTPPPFPLHPPTQGPQDVCENHKNCLGPEHIRWDWTLLRWTGPCLGGTGLVQDQTWLKQDKQITVGSIVA